MASPCVNIVVESGCTQCPKNPVASRSDRPGKPARVRWHAAVECQITFPKGYFIDSMSKKLEFTLAAGHSSKTYHLSPKGATGPTEYQIGCPAGSSPPNPPMITIES